MTHPVMKNRESPSWSAGETEIVDRRCLEATPAGRTKRHASDATFRDLADFWRRNDLPHRSIGAVIYKIRTRRNALLAKRGRSASKPDVVDEPAAEPSVAAPRDGGFATLTIDDGEERVSWNGRIERLDEALARFFGR